MGPYRWQLLNWILVMALVTGAAVAGVFGFSTLMYVLSGVLLLSFAALLVRRCPRCKYPLWKSSGDWSTERPRALTDAKCSKCGLDLAKPYRV